jgi:hypothetical protein
MRLLPRDDRPALELGEFDEDRPRAPHACPDRRPNDDKRCESGETE